MENITRKHHRSGFSLVEISLALLVASIGLLAVMGMFPASLELGNRAINETYASFLADSAIASFKGAADLGYWNGGNGKARLENYEPFGPNTIDRNRDIFWRDSVDLSLIADGNLWTNIYVANSSSGSKWFNNFPILPSNWSMVDHALRYRINITNVSARIKGMRIEVWMGQYGNIDEQEPEVFYTEIFRHD